MSPAQISWYGGLEGEVRSRKFTVVEYYRAAEAGIFRPDERLELVAGRVIEKLSPQGRLHAAAVTRTARALRKAFGDGFEVRVQAPVRLAEESEPEPDLAVVLAREDDYSAGHPGPSEIALIVEVSDSSLAFDRGGKLAVYAAAKLPEYWILNLVDHRLEVHKEPSLGPDGIWRYGLAFELPHNSDLRPIASPSSLVTVRELLPKTD